MTFLINCTNLRYGGGLQVAKSIFEQLTCYPHHQFIIALSSELGDCAVHLDKIGNARYIVHDILNTPSTLFWGRDTVLDELEKEVDAVLTIFGPSRWQPRKPHLCGFARAQLVLKDSPYYQMISWKEKMRYRQG